MHLFELVSEVLCELRQYLNRSGCQAQSNKLLRIFDPYSNRESQCRKQMWSSNVSCLGHCIFKNKSARCNGRRDNVQVRIPFTDNYAGPSDQPYLCFEEQR